MITTNLCNQSMFGACAQGVFKKLKGVAAAYRLNLAGPLSAQLKSDSNAVTEHQVSIDWTARNHR